MPSDSRSLCPTVQRKIRRGSVRAKQRICICDRWNEPNYDSAVLSVRVQRTLRTISIRRILHTRSEKKPRLLPGQRRFMERLLDCFRRCKYSEPVTAFNCDPLAVSTKWSPLTAHLVIDVERAVEAVIKRQPNAKELRDSWEQLVRNEERIGPLRPAEILLIRVLVPCLEARGVSPETYFRKTWRAA